MNCSKFREIFDPEKVRETIHIIGCGSVGSTLAELLSRYGLKQFELYDFDIVESKNIANQMYRDKDIGRPKVEALRDIMLEINPEAAPFLHIHPEGYINQPLSGYVFLAVDHIETRKEICEKEQYNALIKAVFDIRTGLYDAQHLAANWSKLKEKQSLIRTMQFSQEEAKKATPVSACGVEFGVAPTIRMVCTVAVANFINFVLLGDLKKLIFVNPFNFTDGNTVVVA